MSNFNYDHYAEGRHRAYVRAVEMVYRKKLQHYISTKQYSEISTNPEWLETCAFLDGLESKGELGSHVMLTINFPSHDTLRDVWYFKGTKTEYIHEIVSYVEKKFEKVKLLKDCEYSWEYYTESGSHLHIHIHLPFTNKSKGVLINQVHQYFSSAKTPDICRIRKEAIDVKYMPEKAIKDYLAGEKKDGKIDNVNKDTKLFIKLGITQKRFVPGLVDEPS